MDTTSDQSDPSEPVSPPPAGDGADRRREYLVRGRGIKADLYLEGTNGRQVVVKDYRRRSLWGRWIGRFLVRREEKIYRILQGLPGIPALLGVRDGIALVVAHVPGQPIDRYQEYDDDFIVRVLDRLQAIIESMHRRGVAHFDLRRRNNVLVDHDGNVYLIDFAGSLYFSHRSALSRRLFSWLRKVDHSAFLKWKQRLAPASMSAEELSRLRRIGRWRTLWFINRPGSHTS